jgi:PKD repeat protein
MGSTCTGPSTVYPDDGTHAVTIRVADADGVAGSAQRSVAVRNVAPVVTASGSSIDEGGVATVSGTITDPGALDTFTLAVEWGDGTTATVQYPAGTTSFDLDHRYLDDDPTATAHDLVAVTIGVIDDDLGVGTASTAVSVTNVAPTAVFELIADEAGMSVGPAPPSDVEVLLAGLIGTIAVRFADVGTRDAHHATIDWGDGSRWQGALLGSVSGTHAYAQPGRYAIAVTVVDDDTGSVTVGRTVEVVDAEGAVANVIDRLRRALADPTIDPTVALRLRAALVVLEGNANGLARNGALDHLELTAWSAALVGIRDAVITLQDAGWDGAPSQLTLAAKALVLELIASAEQSATTSTASAAVAAARGWVAHADASTDLVAKLDALQLALNALRPAMS